MQRLDLSQHAPADHHAPADRCDPPEEAASRPPTRFTDFQAGWPSLWFRLQHTFEWCIDALLIGALAAIYAVPRPEFGVQRVFSDWSALLWLALFARLIHNLLHFFLSLALMPAQILFCEGALSGVLPEKLRASNVTSLRQRTAGRAHLVLNPEP